MLQCSVLEENGSESLFLSFTAGKGSEHQGSTLGEKFIVYNDSIIQKFQEFCGTCLDD